MVANPFALMAETMLRVADDVHGLLHAHAGKPAQGSPAAGECDGDPFRGEWGSPTTAAVGYVVLSATACQDHLRAASILLRSRTVTLSPHTVIRGAAEAAALGSYLVDPDVDQRERVRRGVNIRLAGLCQEKLALRRFADSDPEAVAKIADIEQVIGGFERSASAQGFAFAAANRFTPAHLDAKTPSTTELLGRYVFPGAPTLGRAYYSGLSSVAHSQLNGLMRKVVSNGVGSVQVNATAKDTALELLAGPLAASTLVEYMAPWLGWDATDLNESIPAMFDLWGQIADTPYPGPDSDRVPPRT